MTWAAQLLVQRGWWSDLEPVILPAPSPAPCPALTQGEDLPEQYPKGPHIALCGVHLVEDALGGHPLQRQSGLWEEHVSPVGERREGRGQTLGQPSSCPRAPQDSAESHPKKGFLITSTLCVFGGLLQFALFPLPHPAGRMQKPSFLP